VRLLAAPFDTHYEQLLANVAASSNKGAAHHALLNYSTPSSRLVEARTKRGECFAVALYLSIVVECDVVVFVVAVERAKQPVGVLTACKGIVLSCNAECERIFGYGPGEMLGQRVASLVAATANLPSLRVARGDADLALPSAAAAADDDELTLYVDFLQPAQPRKRAVSDISSVNLVAGTPVPSSAASSAAAAPAEWIGDSDADADIDVGALDHFESDDDDAAAAVSDDDDAATASFVHGRTADALTKTASTAMTQTFRAVEVETDCVDKIGRHFSARVLLQRKRMGVVELFRGFIQPIVGGDMAVLLITDADGHILSVSQMYCKAMLGYSTLELVQMNINEVLTGLPVSSAPPRTSAAAATAAAAAAAAAATAAAAAAAEAAAAAATATPIVDDASESISVAAPGIRIPRATAAGNNSGVTSLSASGESSTLESVLRESASAESDSALNSSFIGATSDEDDDDDDDDDDDLSDGTTSPRASSPRKRELVTSTVKRARAEHGSAVFVRHNTDVSPNFAYSVGRRTTARHKSGAQIVLLMDVMRFSTHDGQVRFSVRLYTPMAVDEGTMTPPSQQAPPSNNTSRRPSSSSSSSSMRRRSSTMASATVSEAASPPTATPPPPPPPQRPRRRRRRWCGRCRFWATTCCRASWVAARLRRCGSARTCRAASSARSSSFCSTTARRKSAPRCGGARCARSRCWSACAVIRMS
jgi:hypothetical protein